MTPDYEPSFKFTGTIEKVTIDLKGDKHVARLKGGD